MKRALAAIALVLAGCSPAAVQPVTLRGGANGLTNLPAGRYTFAWSGSCTAFHLEWAPTSGAPPIVISDAPSGQATIELPGGPAYVNRGGSCDGDYTVTIQPAG